MNGKHEAKEESGSNPTKSTPPKKMSPTPTNNQNPSNEKSTSPQKMSSTPSKNQNPSTKKTNTSPQKKMGSNYQPLPGFPDGSGFPRRTHKRTAITIPRRSLKCKGRLFHSGTLEICFYVGKLVLFPGGLQTKKHLQGS